MIPYKDMSKRVLLPAVLGLIIASAYAGFHFYHYQQAEKTTPAPVAEIDNNKTKGNRLIEAARITGVPRPEFSLPDLNGRLRSINEWDGKVIALNFWATWCPPCLEEIPEFVLLQAKYQADGLQFIGIALQQPDAVRQFVKEHGMNYPVLTGETEVIKLAESYGNHIGALPYTVVIDRNGLVAYVKPGPLSREQAESVITSLL